MNNDERTQAYLHVIEKLLNCPTGEETEILNEHLDLIDDGLVQAMEEVAKVIEERGEPKAAQFLHNISSQISERLTGYFNLIQALLDCSPGEEGEILQANAEIIDDVLVQTMQHIGEEMRERGEEDSADFLESLAAELDIALRKMASVGDNPDEYFVFLREVLQAVSENPDPQAVYPLLSANLDKLDPFFAELLQGWAMATLPEADPDECEGLAGLLGTFSNLMQQFPDGDKGNNLEIAIAGYEVASSVFTREEFPDAWAGTQNNLAAAYFERVMGDRSDNLNSAIACYENALQVYTLQTFPEQWARTQKKLAIVQGERDALKR